jgi:tetratricopeptide (TPR) repeat protein
VQNNFPIRRIRTTVEPVQKAATIRWGKCWLILGLTTGVMIGCGNFFITPMYAADTNAIATHAEKVFTDAQRSIRQQPTNVVTLLQLSAAAFNWAEFARKDSQRAEIANDGIDAAREAIHLAPKSAAAHYWLGMNLGQLARTKTLGALHLVRQMEDEFKQALQLDPKVDYAGPDRSLGYLYRDTPGWPTSIGSKKKAREHLERAVQLHPDFPDNQLALLETFYEWDDTQGFARHFAATEKTITEARKKFTGPEWDQSWADWNSRWAKLKNSEQGKSAAQALKRGK